MIYMRVSLHEFELSRLQFGSLYTFRFGTSQFGTVGHIRPEFGKL